ncbi:hypothetical protein CgunFtcFv8_004331 [Champsocephalus gunnari]|uniref:Uncharacterized protein n=1 Tax=Champsocephalus gunnari TaxID=52237 RepID=A0AAN8E139_CHAGU|nr:hypothetical protein CgunFtcFv8_004331 [Champsocephalus gunnari]
MEAERQRDNKRQRREISGREEIVMGKSGPKNDLSFSPFRWRRHAAKNRRFCIVWINRVVNKQVEKQTAEINAELLDLWYTLTETMSDIQNMRGMVSEIQELGEMAVAANEIFLNYTRQEQEERVLLRCHRRIEQEYMEESKEEEKDEANPVNLETLRQSPDVGTSNRDTSDAANDSVPSSPPAIFEEEENQEMSSDVATVADTSRLKEYSRIPFDPGFTTAGLGCEEERVRVDGTKEEEEDVQTEIQWKEWMDKQEMTGHTYKVKQVDQQNTETPREAAHPQKEVMQNPKEVKAVKKMKTLFFDLMNPFKFHKWERFEDED